MSRITSKWTYLRLQKVPSMSKFWDKDVSKRPEFPELYVL